LESVEHTYLGARMVEAYVNADQNFERVALGLPITRLKKSTLDLKMLEVLETL
jgi:hypothetical protein